MNIEVSFDAGSEIEESCEEAIKFAKKNECWVEFKYNGVEMMVNGNSDSRCVANEYLRRLKALQTEEKELNNILQENW